MILKLTFYSSRLLFGKVFTPLRVHFARLPTAFFLFYGKVSRLDKKLLLEPEIAMLILQQVARINICHFCLDTQRWSARRLSQQ